MQTVRPSQVPEYLRTSGFFQGLNVTDDDEFFIPSNHMKLNANVDSLADMTELLNTIRFWGSDIFPQAMIDFAAHQSDKDLFRSVLEPFRDDLKFITTVCSIIADDVDHNLRLEKAMESGNIDVVHYFHNKRSPISSRAIALAAGQGALDCLDYALTFGFRYNAHHNLVFSEAVRNGHINSILYLRQKGFCHHSYTSPDLVEIAAASGQLVVLKYLYSQKCSFHSAAIAAADAGHFDCLVYALTNGAPLHDDPPYAQQTGSVTHRLARAGLLDYFQVAISSGFNADTPTALIFARSGNLEYLQLSIEHGARPSVKLIASAAQKGHLDCLKFLHQLCFFRAEASGNGLDWRAYAVSVSYGSFRFTDVALSTASAQQWECLSFLITHGCTMNKSLTTCLIQSDQVELYHLATAHGCNVSVQAACQFVSVGNIDLLQHALEHGCERSEEILRAAARHGQLQCLKYAHAQGCPCSAQVSLAAARGGHLTCLQYLHERGCPWDARVRSAEHQQCILDYADAHSCPSEA